MLYIYIYNSIFFIFHLITFRSRSQLLIVPSVSRVSKGIITGCLDNVMFVCHLLRWPDGMRHWPWWRLGAASLLERRWRGSLTQRTEDRGRERGEYTTLQPEHGGPASVGHMRQHSHSDGTVNPYLHRFYRSNHTGSSVVDLVLLLS